MKQQWFVSFVHAVNHSSSFSYSWVVVSTEGSEMTYTKLREISDSLEKMFPGETISLLNFAQLATGLGIESSADD